MDKLQFACDILEARLLIEACLLYEERLTERARATEDEDEQADLSNDAALVGILGDALKAAARDVFGPDVTDFSRPPTF